MFSRLRLSSFVLLLTNVAAAQFTVLSGPCDFGAAQVVGVGAWTPGAATRLGFDLLPNGSALATPNPVPNTGLFVSQPLAGLFTSVGVAFDASDVAVSQPANPGGLGLQSPPNALTGAGVPPFNQSITITFVDPVSGAPATVPAAGLWIADGPTNDVTITFFDGSSTAITSFANGPTVWFVGIEAPGGIGSVLLTSSANDDYYVDDLYYGPAPFAGGLQAAEVVRVGAPANPAALLPGQTSGPVLGNTWDPVVDHTTFLPTGVVDLLAIGVQSSNVPFPAWGTILCDQLLGVPLLVVASATFSLPLPPECALMGVALHAQGASTDGVTVALTNALDVTLGNL